ncbi:MAG: DHH family phosphoesterase [bacterium]
MFDAAFLEAFHDSIHAASEIIIVVHEYPDLDAIGSALALDMAFSQQGFNSRIWVAEPLNHSFSFLPELTRVGKKLGNVSDTACIVFLDSSHKERVAQHALLDPILEHVVSINIDHHCDNSRFATFNCVQDVSSVGEMISILCSTLKWPITKDMATCLYAAICFDTGRFAYSNTRSQTMHVVAKLLDTGIDPNIIYQEMYENKTLSSFKLLKLALDNLIVCREAGYAYTQIPLSAPKGSFKLVDFIRQLKDIDVFVVIQAVNSHKVKVNLRSKKHFDVSAFANQFGGGGHVRASGLVFRDMPLDECVTTIIHALDTALAATAP